MILLDTSGLLAALDEASRLHARAQRSLHGANEWILSPLVLAELDYMITARLGTRAALELLDDVAAGAYELATLTNNDVGAARVVLDRYSDLDIGLTDASIVVLAERYDCNRVLTLDERHFRALRTLDGRPFTLLPADA